MSMCGFCNVLLCVCVKIVVFGCVYVWGLQCVGVCMCGFLMCWCVCMCVCVCGFCNVCVCV